MYAEKKTYVMNTEESLELIRAKQKCRESKRKIEKYIDSADEEKRKKLVDLYFAIEPQNIREKDQALHEIMRELHIKSIQKDRETGRDIFVFFGVIVLAALVLYKIWSSL